MTSVETKQLEEILDEAAPKLDHVLKHGPINEYIKHGNLPLELLRRSGICMYATHLLRGYLQKRDIVTYQHLKWMGTSRDTDKVHIVLKMEGKDDRYIDPTWQQFFYLTGLMPQLAQHDSRQAELYPENRIAVFNPDDDNFVAEVARHAQAIDKNLDDIFPEREKLEQRSGLPLINTSIDEKERVYREIWNTHTYRSNYHTFKPEIHRALFETTKQLCSL